MMFVIFSGNRDRKPVAINPQMVSAVVPTGHTPPTCKVYLIMMDDPIAEVAGSLTEVTDVLNGTRPTVTGQ